MAWGKSVSTDGDGTGGYTTSSYTEKQFNNFMMYTVNTTSNAQYLRPNSDNDSQYAYRENNNGLTDGTSTSGSTGIQMTGGSTTPTFVIGYFCDIASEEKLFIGFCCEQQTAGAGTAPQRRETVGKLVDTTRITSMEVNASAGNNTTDSNISILGTD